MPSQSTITDNDKSKIKSVVPTKILAAALVRLYYSYPQPDKWCYTGLEGALVFTLDKSDGAHRFKLIDIEDTRGILWEHELYENFEYNSENEFFHSFEGDACMIGFIFANENEAQSFSQKVISNKDSQTKSPKKKKAAKGGKIDKSMISGPQIDSFKHLAHLGYDEKSGFTSTGVDPSWTHLLDDLGDRGISHEIIVKEREFIKNFTREYTAAEEVKVQKPKAPPPPPPTRSSHIASGSTSSTISATNHAPPPPPPARAHRPLPPPRAQKTAQPVYAQDIEQPSLRAQSIAPPLPPIRAQNMAPPPPPVRAQISAPPLPKRLPARSQTPPEVPASPKTTPPPVLPRRSVTQSKQPPPPPPARPLSTVSAVPPAPPRPSTLSARPTPPRRPTPASNSVRPTPPPRPKSTAPHPALPPPTGAPPPPPPIAPPTIAAPPPPRATGPPPPPPPTFAAPPPPPPPIDAPPPVKAVLPPPQPGRGDLLASIQGKGIHSLKKTDSIPSPARVSSVPADSGSLGSSSTVAVAATGGAAVAGGGDLTSALAAALLERNKRLGDSDDDDDDDEDDWD